jgi:hypothetical protein
MGNRSVAISSPASEDGRLEEQPGVNLVSDALAAPTFTRGQTPAKRVVTMAKQVVTMAKRVVTMPRNGWSACGETGGQHAAKFAP